WSLTMSSCQADGSWSTARSSRRTDKSGGQGANILRGAGCPRPRSPSPPQRKAPMHLETSIGIPRPPQEVWAFLGEVSNSPRWDRGVAGVEQASPGPMGVGSEFATLAGAAGPDGEPARGRMSYRIAEVDPDRQRCSVQLTSADGNARYFKQASWALGTAAVPGGTLLSCSADFALRARYLILAPVLYLMKGAIPADPVRLKRAIGAQEAPA